MRDAKSCLSYWYSRLVEEGFPLGHLPRTEIVRTDIELDCLLDGRIPKGFRGFIEQISAAVQRSKFGYPCFIRTGHLSGKHRWKDTCYLPNEGAIAQHVANLVEESALADMMGFPTQVWVLRELLPTKTAFVAFGGIPIIRERRYFIRDGRVEFHHPYWPPDALEQGSHKKPLPEDWRCQLAELNRESVEEISILRRLSMHVASIFHGYWSVDWLHADQWLGWRLIDMAEGERSFRWDDYECPSTVMGKQGE